MDTNHVYMLVALIFQFLGILVGAYTVLEITLRTPPIKALLTSLNISYGITKNFREHRLFRNMKLPSFIHEYNVTDELNELYSIFSKPLFLSVMLVGHVFIIGLILGIYPFIIFQFTKQILNASIFWVLFSIWVIILVDFYLRTLMVRYEFEKHEIAKHECFKHFPFIVRWIMLLLWHMVYYPVSYIRIVLILLLIVVLVLPGILIRLFSNFNISDQNQRRVYFIVYTTVMLLISVIIQIVMVVTV